MLSKQRLRTTKISIVIAAAIVSVFAAAQVTQRTGDVKAAPPTLDSLNTRTAAMSLQIEKLQKQVESLTTDLTKAKADIVALNDGLALVHKPPQGYSQAFGIKLNWDSIPSNAGFFYFIPAK